MLNNSFALEIIKIAQEKKKSRWPARFVTGSLLGGAAMLPALVRSRALNKALHARLGSAGLEALPWAVGGAVTPELISNK